MPGLNEKNTLLASERIREKFESKSKEDKILSVSIGAVVIRDSLESGEEVIEFTDNCLYEAKKQGKNCVVLKPFQLSETN